MHAHKRTLTWFCSFLSILFLVLSLIPFSGAVVAQDDIDDVINNLEADFQFGGKEDVKQSNLNNTNEQNREDIKITEQENLQNAQDAAAVMVDVILDLETVTDPITVEIVGGSTLVSGSMGFSQHNLQFPAGSSQTLKITCNGSSCSYHFFFVKGATWDSTTGPALETNTSGMGNMDTFLFTVNGDNSGPTLINPGPTPS